MLENVEKWDMMQICILHIQVVPNFVKMVGGEKETCCYNSAPWRLFKTTNCGKNPGELAITKNANNFKREDGRF